MLILKLPHRRWSLPLVEEEEDDEMGEGALGASLWVALLSMLSGSRSVRSGMICLGSFSYRPPPSRIRPYPLYTKIGWVHGGLEC
jgi:hypothetical protein